MGAAILYFQKQGKAARLRVLSSMFEEDEMPVKHLFRSVPEMPVLEQKALQLAKGRVLDIGAGSGCHTLALQEKGLDGEGDRYFALELRSNEVERSEGCGMHQSLRPTSEQWKSFRRESGESFRRESGAV